ncbi:MAG: hypothetical protein Q9191_003441 [Dirinaria sp. TL-2023a]
MDPEVVADLSLRRLFCDFLCASLLIVIARDEDNIESQLQHYLNVRKAANDFRKRLQEQLERLEGGAKEDLSRKHNSLLAYDFEAAARLKAWESFEPLIKGKKDCEANPDPKIYAIMADIVLSCEAPTEELEYLATTAFNRAVDFYCASQDAACRRWAGKALEMTELCSDGGALRDLLMDKFARLTWDGAGVADAGGGGKERE